MSRIAGFLQTLEQRQWEIKTQEPAALPTALQLRYPTLPTEVSLFLGSLQTCHNRQDTTWFLTPSNAHRKPFPWNCIELMSLESAESQTEKDAIQHFWSAHFPFLFCVHSDYDYLAVRLSDNGFGNIVHGFTPYWEEPSLVALDFNTFLESFTLEAYKVKPTWPFSLFL